MRAINRSNVGHALDGETFEEQTSVSIWVIASNEVAWREVCCTGSVVSAEHFQEDGSKVARLHDRLLKCDYEQPLAHD